MNGKEKARFFIYAGLFSLAFFSALNYAEAEPFHTFYYVFAWWPYIFLADGIIFLKKGESLIISRTKEFLLMLPWSAFIWFIFEIINVRIQNWHYLFLPASDTLRWTGYFLSYATVLPAVFETAELLESFGLFGKARLKPVKIKVSLLYGLFFSGLLSLALVYFFPRYFFWLTWGAFIFLLEPLNYRLGLPSLLRELAQGKAKKPLLLLASGLVCGIIWESLNYHAGAKWVYTVPFVENFMKIFEMPIPGFLGFPPFALEAYSIYSFITYIRRGKNHEPGSSENLKIKKNINITLFAYTLLVFTSLWAVSLIDTHTVWLYKLTPY